MNKRTKLEIIYKNSERAEMSVNNNADIKSDKVQETVTTKDVKGFGQSYILKDFLISCRIELRKRTHASWCFVLRSDPVAISNVPGGPPLV